MTTKMRNVTHRLHWKALLAAAAFAAPSWAQAPAAPTADQAPASTEAPPPPAPLSESLTGPAKSEYEAGKLLYVDGDYAGALIKFEAALKASGDPRLLWNMAASEKNLRHYARALTLLERYEREGASKLTSQDLGDAQALREAMTPFVGRVTVKVDQPGATVFVDDEEVGTAPLEGALLVDIGQHVIRVTKEGYLDFTHKERVSGGPGGVIDAKLEKQKTTATLIVNAGTQDSIRVDGKVVGLGSYSATLPAGKHQVLVQREGYRDYRGDVVLIAGEREQVSVKLDAEADEGGVPAWVWITGGVVVAGLGTGAFFLLRPDDEPAETVQGTIPPGQVQLPLIRY